MRNNVLTVATMMVIALFSSCSGHEEMSDLEYYGLMGKVKSVTSVSYDVYDKFGEGNLQKVKPEYGIVQITSFDSLGNILSDRFISINEIKRKYTVVVNDKRQQTKWICYDDKDDTKVQYGTNYYYDDHGNLAKEIDLTDQDVTMYKNTYDSEGRLVFQIGGPNKKYWEYENGELIKSIEHFFDMTTELYYKDDLLYKDVRSPTIYWTYSYDNLNRKYEDVMYENEIIKKKIRRMYSKESDFAPTETIEWNEDGTIVHDSKFSYFTVGNDTLTIFQYDMDKLINIQFYIKDTQGITEDTYNTESSLLMGFQFNYEKGVLVSMKDLKTGTDHLYIDGIATVTEGDDNVTETKYKRNIQLSRVIKDQYGKVIFSYCLDGDDNKKTITINDNGETKKSEQIYENGKIVKETDISTGRTDIFSYNEAGLISEVKSSDGTSYTYKYDIDHCGNWIKQIEYKNGTPNKIVERSIIYYD